MPLSRLNYINVGPKGTFQGSGQVQTQPGDVDAIFKHLEQNQIRKLTVHFHGGLINEAEGMKIAEKLEKAYAPAGGHPVTFVWETGLLETITRNLDTVYKTSFFQAILKVLLKKVMEKLGVSVGGRGGGGVLDETEIDAELRKDSPFEDVKFTAGARGGAATLDDAGADIARQEVQEELTGEFDTGEVRRLLELEEAAPQTPFLKRDEIVATKEEGDRALFTATKAAISVAQIFYRVVKRFIQNRDHGFYPTVIEELLRKLFVDSVGGWIWAGMKRAGQQMWKPNGRPGGVELHAGRYFLEKVAAYQQARPLIVDFIGHSAGSIAILEMLRAVRSSGVNVNLRSVFFMAPACTSKLFQQSLAGAPWQRFRIFTMSDTYEKQDKLVPVIYPRSLLYFVSGLLEDDVDEPILGMQRFWSGQAPFDQPYLLDVRRYVLDSGAGRLALSVWNTENPGAAPDFRTSSTSHGGFDDDDDTLGSIRTLIGQ